VAETLELCLLDNQQAWHLLEDGSYQCAKPGKQKPVSSQETLLELLSQTSTEGKRAHRILKSSHLRAMRLIRKEEEPMVPPIALPVPAGKAEKGTGEAAAAAKGRNKPGKPAKPGKPGK